MLKLFQFLLTGCWHKWEILYNVKYNIWDKNPTDVVETTTKFILRCKHCGRMKTFIS